MLGRLEEALDGEASLGQTGLRLEYQGTDGDEAIEPPNAPPGYPVDVEVYVAAHVIEG